MTEKQQLYDLYKLYGLDKAEETEDQAIFTYSNGYFNNAEIVQFGNDDSNIEDLKVNYQRTGYAVRVIVFNSINEVHSHLFSGFFTVSQTNQRLQMDYGDFCKLQSDKLYNVRSEKIPNAKYEYVEPSYIWGNELRKGELIENIEKQLFEDGPQLIILEAAAGFGKTCASYELINRISSNNNKIAPMFMELSKNRKATLFRYVLLDEIDKKFPSLSSTLVMHEIKQGNIALIIDGFDELISRSNRLFDTNNLDDEDAQTMLDTIAEIFDEQANAKIVLTSRKSSMFTGEIFKNWTEDKLKNCNVNRVAIQEPTVEDWLGYIKTDILKEKNIPVDSIKNPILLAFLKNMSDDDFCEKCSDIEKVIKYYFDSLLERERERQSLRLEITEQYDIMVKLAQNMLEFDISSDEISFIKELLIDINKSKFKEYRERYFYVEERPSEEEFAAKLSGHALLNRISPNKNKIGFINDFVFGILISDTIRENLMNIDNISNRHLDIACTSAAVRSELVRNDLYNKIKDIFKNLNYEEQLNIDIKLQKKLKQNYTGHYFENMSFGSEINFDGEFWFQECIFKRCTFNACRISTSSFRECNFYECIFYNLSVDGDAREDCRLNFAGCYGHEELQELSKFQPSNVPEKRNYKKYILEQFWSSGRYAKGKVHQQVVLKEIVHEEKGLFEDAIEELKKEDIISKDGQFWVINKEKMKEVREKLGK